MTGFSTVIAGPGNANGAANADVRYLGISADANTSVAQEFVAYVMSEGYSQWLSQAPEGKFPVRRGTTAGDTSFEMAWAGLDVGVDRKAPLGDIYPQSVIDDIVAGLSVGDRWGVHKALETTMVYVTHDQVEAMTLADRIVVLKDGLIMQVGTPRELYEKPDNVFVAQFIGSPKMNLIACATDAGFTTRPDIKTGAVQLGIRPEHIAVTDVGAGHCDGVVQVSEYLGADFFHYIDCGPLGLLTVRTSGAFPDIEGQTVGLKFENDNLHFLGSDDVSL